MLRKILPLLCCILSSIIGIVVFWSWRGLLIDYYAIYHAALSAGVLSGSLHALTGSDHTAAILPLTINKRWWQSSVFGLVWGLGHGLTSLCVGWVAFAMKGLLVQAPDFLQGYQFVGDFVVGITLLVIGAMGLHEAHEKEGEGAKSQGDVEEAGTKAEGSSLPLSPSALLLVGYGTIFVNGVTLGLSWDGLPSLAPALLLDPSLVLAFLLAYLLGTALIMALAAGLLGEASYWVSRQGDGVAGRLARFSSLAAWGLGLGWLARGGVKFAYNYRPPVHNNDGTSMGPSSYVLEDVGVNALLHAVSVLVVLGVLVLSIYREASLPPWLCVRGKKKEKVDYDLTAFDI